MSVIRPFFNFIVYTGGYLIVTLTEVDVALRVRGDVLHVLQKDQIKHIKKQNLWYADVALALQLVHVNTTA